MGGVQQYRDAKYAAFVSTGLIGQSAGSLEETVRNNAGNEGLHFPIAGIIQERLHAELGFSCEISLILQHSSIWSIVDDVRTLVLNWTLELEQVGVLGEGMTFTQPEKEKGSAVTNNYFAENIGVIGNVTDQAHAVNNQLSIRKEMKIEKVKDLLSQLSQLSPSLPPQVMEKVAPVVEEISEELRRDVPDKGKIRGWLESVKSTCEGATGNLVASGVVEIIKSIVGP